MGVPRFRVGDLVLLVAAVGVGIQTWREFEYSFRDELAFATYLGLLTTAALGLVPRNTLSRPFLAGYATFAAVYFALVLRFGFSEKLGACCDIGIAYGFMAGVASRWVRAGGPAGQSTPGSPLPRPTPGEPP